MNRVSFAIVFAALSIGHAMPARAQIAATACSQNDIATVISAMSEKLRRINIENQKRLQLRLRELAKLKGWSEAETEDKGLDLLEDDETRVQDESASHLLTMVDKLGQSGDSAPPCSQIEELKAVAAQLVEVTTVKAAHVSAKLEMELKSSRPMIQAQPAVTPPAGTPEESKKLPSQPNVAAPVTTTTKPPGKQIWETQTAAIIKPNDAYVPPAASPTPAIPTDPNARLFTPADIRAAGRGLFGTVSAELAAIIEHAFKSYGQPSGYILGTEGGAALLAGLRYGDGTFVTKLDGERKIYWQGPSFGYDLGLTGSRTMILVYNLGEPDEILKRFAGVDGSAYLVGGAGITILKNGPIILAPIRTGLGLRLGANVGYLKFTTRPRFSPF